jgi:hypothetical protein
LTEAQEQELAAEKSCKEAQVSRAFLQYLSLTGVFAEFDEQKEQFCSLHGDDPVMVWEQMRTVSAISELADFAILLLTIVMNQGGAERDFSDLKVKKTQRRSRLKLRRLEKMSKVLLLLLVISVLHNHI